MALALNMLLMKNPQFLADQAETLSILSIHGMVIFTKFHINWTKIVDFSLIAYFSASAIFYDSVFSFLTSLLLNSKILEISNMKYAIRKFFSLECLEMAISYPQSLLVNIRISFRNYHTIVLHIVLWKNEKFGLTDKIFRQINYVVIFLTTRS